MGDKRLFPRYRVSSECKGKLVLAQDIKIINISMGGMLIQCSRRLNTNNRYCVQILAKAGTGITPDCLVQRDFFKGTVEHKDKTLPLYEVAFQFVELSNDEKAFIKRLLTDIGQNEKT